MWINSFSLIFIVLQPLVLFPSSFLFILFFFFLFFAQTNIKLTLTRALTDLLHREIKAKKCGKVKYQRAHTKFRVKFRSGLPGARDDGDDDDDDDGEGDDDLGGNDGRAATEAAATTMWADTHLHARTQTHSHAHAHTHTHTLTRKRRK